MITTRSSQGSIDSIKRAKLARSVPELVTVHPLSVALEFLSESHRLVPFPVLESWRHRATPGECQQLGDRLDRLLLGKEMRRTGEREGKHPHDALRPEETTRALGGPHRPPVPRKGEEGHHEQNPLQVNRLPQTVLYKASLQTQTPEIGEILASRPR